MREIQEGTPARLLTYFANGLLGLSLFLPVFENQYHINHTVYGFEMLKLGVWGPAIGQFGWLGNIALPICGLTQWRWMRLICVLAFFNSLFWQHDMRDSVFWRQEKGFTPVSIDHLIGYYVWMAAMAIGGFALFLPVKRLQSDETRLPPSGASDQ